jgi:hypothetical protein
MCKGNNCEIKLNNKNTIIDGCLKDLIISLNKFGLKTKSSCCGHKTDKGRNIKHIVFELPTNTSISINNNQVAIYENKVALTTQQSELKKVNLVEICHFFDKKEGIMLFSHKTEKEAVKNFLNLYRYKKNKGRSNDLL